MKKLILIATIGLLSSMASAQAPAQPSTGIQLPDRLHNMWLDEFQEIRGTYYLSNGKKMQLSSSNNRIYATFDGVDRVRLVAESPYVFVARDQSMKISLQHGGGDGPITADIVMAGSPPSAGVRGAQADRIAGR